MKSVLSLFAVSVFCAIASSSVFAADQNAMFPGNCIPYYNCPRTSTVPNNLPGKWTQGSFQNNVGSRNYWLYIPQKYTGQAIPLMVMLHGCFQNASDFAAETGMNIIAEKYGFAVLYPEQGFQDNLWKCWNWFRPENQVRNGGELSLVMGMIGLVNQSIRLDGRRVYVAGLSAGAAMASNLLGCHSDVFSGAGIASGLEFRAATSEAEAHQVMRSGSTHDLKQSAADAARCTGQGAKMGAILSIQGTSDTAVNPINADRVVGQFTAMNDLLDDGALNGTQNTNIITSRQDQVPGGYRYRTDFYGGKGAVRIAKVSVERMGHAWSGAAKSGQYADPRGPNASEMIWLFVSNYGGKQSFRRR